MAADSLPSHPDPDRLLGDRAWLRRLSVSLVGPADADDLAQDAWLALLERQRRESGGRVHEAPRGWLAGAARRLALASRRKQASRLGHQHMYAGELAASGRLESEVAVDQLAAQAELQREVVALLLELKEPVRGTLLLRYQAGLSAADIARRTGDPAGTVRRRLKEGLDRVRERMDADHGGRSAWAPALMGVLPCALESSLLSSGSGLVAGTALLGMKKLMWLAVVALFAGAGWLASSAWEVEPESRQVEIVARGVEPRKAFLEPAELVVAPEMDDPARKALAKPAPGASSPRYRVVTEDGEPVAVTRMSAVPGDAGRTLEAVQDGAFVLDDETAELAKGLAALPLVVSRNGAWPHTFEAPLSAGLHTLVWPKGVTLRGRLLERGQRPGERVRLTLKRDVGWSERPYAAQIDQRADPVPRSLAAEEDGTFLLSDLPADWRGWLMIEEAWRFDGGLRQSALIEAGGAGAFDLAIERSPRIIGRVLDGRTGEALAARSIEIIETRGEGSSYYFHGTTDEHGRFAHFLDSRATAVTLRFGKESEFRTRSFEGLEPPLVGTLDLGDIALEEIELATLRIVDSDGRPVAGARVYEQGSQNFVESSVDGKVLLPVQALDSASVEVRAEGHEQAIYPSLALSAATESVIALRPELRFVVRVLDADGNSVPDCQVTFIPIGPPSTAPDIFGMRAPELAAGTVTRHGGLADGRRVFGFSTDEEGRIEVGCLPRDLSLHVGFMDGWEWAEPPLVIRADGRGRWEGTLLDRREPLPEVTGVVTTADGVAISDANVKFPSSLMANYVRTDEAGAFAVKPEWRQGRSHLLVTAPGFAELRHILERETLDSEPLRLTLQKERPLTVRLMDANGAPVSDATLSVAVSSGGGQWSHAGSEVPDSAGYCRVQGLGPGELRLTARRDGVSYQRVLPAESVEATLELGEPATVVVDWSALVQKEVEPSHILLRRPLLAGQGPTDGERIDRLTMQSGSHAPTSTSFRCSAGQYEVVAFTGHSRETVKVVATVEIEVRAAEQLRVELPGTDGARPAKPALGY
ncbi:RNA polymerase sigma factor [Planctomycetes bacterium Poly30]|uniref:RNA polymerase sigma factor n=1 Tax=Saltatorellus ferox TaxID=2528018 RepID=A0A518EY23_9BACT|nr:RNA polymerase sigma factor [Planctomycetes bacterium Poly30]